MTAFSSCSDKKGKIILKYMRWADPAELKSTRELMDLFMKQNPDIEVKLYTEAWNGYWDKIQTQLAAGIGPDVFLIGAYYITDFYKKNICMNLQPFIEKDKDLDINDFFKPPFELYTFNNNLYALPRDINTIILYYNKDLFDTAGVSYPNNNWTWNDLVKAGKQLTKDLNGDGIVDQFAIMTSLVYEVCWGNFVLQNNGRLLNTSKIKCIANSPEVVETIQFLYDLENKHKIAPTSRSKESLGENSFLTGRIAMIPDGSWRVGTYRDALFRWDIAMLPKKKRRACIANGVAHAINSTTKNAEAAWRLVKFLSGKDAQIAVAKSGTSIPIRKSIANSPHYLDNKPENKINCIKSIEYGHNYPITSRLNEWLDVAIIQELELAFLDKKTIKQAMNDAVIRVDKILFEVNQ